MGDIEGVIYSLGVFIGGGGAHALVQMFIDARGGDSKMQELRETRKDLRESVREARKRAADCERELRQILRESVGGSTSGVESD